MSNNPRKRPTSEELARPDVEPDPLARIIDQLVRQLEPYLPIDSLEKITEELGEVVVDNHRLPLKIVAPHISIDLFPIESTEDLVQKLSGGVRRAVALGHSRFFPIRNRALREIFATTLHGKPVRHLGVPGSYHIYNPASASGSPVGKGDK